MKCLLFYIPQENLVPTYRPSSAMSMNGLHANAEKTIAHSSKFVNIPGKVLIAR